MVLLDCSGVVNILLDGWRTGEFLLWEDQGRIAGLWFVLSWQKVEHKMLPVSHTAVCHTGGYVLK